MTRTRPGTAAAVAAVAVAVMVTFVLTARGDGDHSGNTAQHASSGATERPADWSAYRPAFHLTPERHWMNDVQRPFFLDGRWHLYYLYNADHPTGNGTEWFHATSTDLVHWTDEGVAIEKYVDGLGDIETGSAVVDVHGTAGFGAGAVVAIMTQQLDGIQRQSLYYSTDGGDTFTAYDANPVMDNPGVTHWRDPKVFWDDASSQWTMVLAEGHKLGFYTSPDLKSWTYRSAFERDDLGILECPDLFEMTVDGDPGRRTWVLAASANGAEHGRTTGLAYWTGSWDGQRFVPDRDDPLWLDSGADFYAAVTWDDPRADPATRLEERYALGWMNNWAYAGALPTADWAGGMASTARRLRLRTIGGRPTLTSTPVEAVAALESEPRRADRRTIGAGVTNAVPQPESDAYRLRVVVAPAAGDPAREVRLRLKQRGGSFVTVGVDFATRTAFVARDLDAAAPTMPDAYREIRTARVPGTDGAVELDILADTASVEVFVDGGVQALSSLVFPDPGANGLSVEAVDGGVELREFAVSPLAVAAPTRE